jgi:DNA-binding NarL/FixJ family response regulator
LALRGVAKTIARMAGVPDPFEQAGATVEAIADLEGRPTVAVAIRELLVAQALGHVMRSANLHVVGCFATLEALLAKIRRCRPELVVADADLRDGPHGADAFLARQREAGPKTKLVVLADEVDGPLARAVVAHDVRALILMSTPVADALAVIQQVLHDRTSFPAAVLARLDEHRDEHAMSSRQLEVLEQLALGRSNQEIARHLFISVNTVKFHLQAIYDRLGVHNRVEAAAALSTARSDVSGPAR